MKEQRLFLLASVLLSLFAYGCANRAQISDRESHAVKVAALRYMLSRSASKSAQAEYSAFVVPKEYASYFSDIRPAVLPFDDKRFSSGKGRTIDLLTGGHVMIWTVSQVEITGDTATCYVMWDSAERAAGGHTVYLRKLRGLWVAEREEGLWISQAAEQAGTANAGICHAACFRKHFEMKRQTPDHHAARGAPAPVVADL